VVATVVIGKWQSMSSEESKLKTMAMWVWVFPIVLWYSVLSILLYCRILLLYTGTSIIIHAEIKVTLSQKCCRGKQQCRMICYRLRLRHMTQRDVVMDNNLAVKLMCWTAIMPPVSRLHLTTCFKFEVCHCGNDIVSVPMKSFPFPPILKIDSLWSW